MFKYRTVFLFLAAGLWLQAGGILRAEVVHFKTADGCLLEASYRPPSSGGLVFINLHGLGSDRGEWAVLERRLAKNGYGWLSADFRGHGGSLECSGFPADYRTFSPAGWKELSADIAAASDFLKSRKIPQKRTVLCGASIGANLSLKAAAEGLRPAGIALLSPGLSYAGIEAEAFLKDEGAVPLLIAASRNDPYAWKSSERLAAQARSGDMQVVFKAGPGGHGANMLSESKPALLDFILDWAKHLPGSSPASTPGH